MVKDREVPGTTEIDLSSSINWVLCSWCANASRAPTTSSKVSFPLDSRSDHGDGNKTNNLNEQDPKPRNNAGAGLLYYYT